MEDFENFEIDSASGINTDISGYLDDRFNYPGTDGTKPVQSASGFDSYLNDRF
ncbi:MAG: hypothetical protein M0P71_17025 [Melioribacteraceae bacterium]|nr:hypothetical protein [Melioribacteraceae bacterium]